jgi:hypothetical protein
MKEERVPVAWYQRPIWLGLVGLALMIGGWKVSTYRPASRGDGLLAEIKGMVGEQSELAERLDRVANNLRGDPPYQLPGRLVLVAGLVLFVSAAVLMYQSPPPSREEAESRRE